MQVWEGLAVAAAGAGAGAINAVVGSGTLITFPTLLALGYPPVTANVSNNIGLVVGGLSGSWGYRRELRGQRDYLRRLAPMSVLGAVTGAVLLLRLPPRAFETIVPVLIGAAVVMVIAQPRIAKTVASRGGISARPGPLTLGGVLGAGVYGGYFGAAQGVLMIGVLGSTTNEPLQRVNAAKNVLTSIVNFVAAVTFVVLAAETVDWAVAGLIAAGSLVGGLGGAAVGRHLRPVVLRAAIVVVGCVAIARLVTS